MRKYETVLQQAEEGRNPIPEDAKSRLEDHLKRYDEGRSHDIRTPIFNQADRETIISRMYEEVGFCGIPEVDEMDKAQSEKVGPYSVRLPYAEWEANVLEFSNQKFDPDPAAFFRAVARYRAEIPRKSLRLISEAEVIKRLPKNTNLGIPRFSSKSIYIKEYVDRARLLNGLNDYYPFILFWRGQPTGWHSDPKQRPIAGSDHIDPLRGGRFWYSLLHYIQANDLAGYAALINPHRVNMKITKMLKQSNGVPLIGIDYSKFDASLHRDFAKAIADCGKEWCVDGDDLIDLSVEYATSGDWVVPNQLFRSSGGVRSGSIVTTWLGTAANKIAYYYIDERLNLGCLDAEVMGDDGVYQYQKQVELGELSEVVSELGLTSNPDKVHYDSESVHYLQNMHSIKWQKDGLCVGMHSPYRSMSGHLGYENSVDIEDKLFRWIDLARRIMQSEVYADHPLHEKAVRFWASGDKYALKHDPVDVFRKAGGSHKVGEILRVPSFPFNKQDPSKIDSFKTTKILRLMR